MPCRRASSSKKRFGSQKRHTHGILAEWVDDEASQLTLYTDIGIKQNQEKKMRGGGLLYLGGVDLSFFPQGRNEAYLNATHKE